jgi:hypothetical protein
MPPKQELQNREGNCAFPASHRNEFPAEYSLEGCSPAEPASASPAVLILLPWTPFAYQLSANGKLHNRPCLKKGLTPLRKEIPKPAQ